MPTFNAASHLVDFDEIHILITRPPSDEVVLDTTIVFPAGVDSLELTFDVPLAEASEQLDLLMELIDQPSGNVVFTVGPTQVTASVGGGAPQVVPPFLYVGPGSNAVGVRFVATTSSAFFGDTVLFTAEAFDASSITIPNTPIRWTVSDTSRATVVADSAGRIVGRNTRGSVNVQASLLQTSASAPPSISHALAIQPLPSTIVAQTGNAQSGTAGDPLALPITARVRATDLLGVQGVVVNFAITSGGGSLSALVDTTDANGDVSVIWTVGTTSGVNNQGVSATVQGLPSATVGFVASANPDAPVRLSFVQPPSSVDETAVMAPPVTIEALDQFGNRATTYGSSVTLTLTGGPGSLGGTHPKNAVSGLVSFDDLTVSAAGSYSMIASEGAMQPDTAAFSVISIGPTHLVFDQPPTTSTAGVAIAPPVQVSLRDVNDNIVASATDLVTIAFAANPGNGTLGGTLSVAAINGVATFTDLVIDSARAGYSLTATSGVLPSETSGLFNVVHAAASRLEFLVQPSNVDETEVITPSVAVRAFDAIGNVANTFVGVVTMEILDNPGSGTLGGTTSRAAAAGVATFDDLTVSSPASGYTLRATSGGMASDTSVTFDVAATIPTKVVIEIEPSTVQAGVVMAPSIQVSLRNNANTLITGATNQVTLSILNDPGGATLGGTVTQNPSGGLVTFPGITLDRSGTGYTLLLSAAGLTPDTTIAFNVLPGPATTLVISTQPPDSVMFDAPFTIAATALDAEGNVATTFGGSVTLAISSNPASGSLYGVTTVGSSLGVATFGGIEIDNIGDGYVLSVSSGVLTGATSTSLDVIGPASANVWINLGGGNWSDALSWSKGVVPSATDTILIRQSGTYTVNFDQGATVQNMVVGGRAGQQTLQLNANILNSAADGVDVGANGRLLLQSSGIITGSGGFEIFGVMDWVSGQIHGGFGAAGLVNVQPGGQLNITNSPIRYLVDYNLSIAGNSIWSGDGFIYTGSSSILSVAAGGALDISGVGQFLYNQGGGISLVQVQSGGSLTRSTDPGSVLITGAFDNNGSLNVLNGVLSLQGGGVSSGGTTSIGVGGTLLFSGGTHDISGGSVSGAGIVQLTGAGTVNVAGGWNLAITQIDGGAFNANGGAMSTAQLNVQGGSLGGSGLIDVTTDLLWTSGNLIGSGGTARVLPGASLTISGATVRTTTDYNLDLRGTGTWSGAHSINTGFGSVFTIAAGATLDIQGDPLFTQNQGGTVTQLRVLGTLTRSTSAGLAHLNVQVDNDGLVDVTSGTLRLSNGTGGGTSDGSYTASAGGTLDFSAGLHQLAAVSDVNGAGTVLISGSADVQSGGGWAVTGTTQITGGRLDANGPAGTTQDLTISGGVLGGAAGGNLTVTDQMTWTGGSFAGSGGTVTAAGPLTISGAATRNFTDYTLELTGSGTWLGTQQINTGFAGVLRVAAGATLDIQGDPTFTQNQGGIVTLVQNLGTITRTTSAGVAIMSVNFDNDGQTTVTSGTLRLANASGPGSADGVYTATGTGTLDFSAGAHVLGATGAVNGNGTILVSGSASVQANAPWVVSGTTQVTGGTLEYNASTGGSNNLDVSGGNLAGATGGIFGVPVSMTWSGGNLVGSGGSAVAAGTLSISGGATRNFTNYTLQLDGTGIWTGTGQINSGFGAVLRVGATGTLDIGGDPIFTSNQGGTIAAVQNLGSITRSTSAGIATFNVNWDNDNLTFVTSGILRLQNGSGPGTADGGYNVSPGGLLDFNGGLHALGAGGSVVGGGTARVSNGTVNVAGPWSVSGTVQVTGGTLNYDAPAGSTGTLALSGGTLGGSAAGLLTVVGNMDWSGGNLAGAGGTTQVDPGAALTISSAATRTFTNYTLATAGIGTWPGTHQVNTGFGAVLRVMDGGTLDIQGDPTFTQNQGGAQTLFFVEPGAFVTRSTSAGIATMNVNFENDGATQATSGTLRLSNGTGAGTSEGSYTATAPGVIEFSNGAHTLDAASLVNGSGIIRTSGGTLNADGNWAVTGTTEVTGGQANFNDPSMTTNGMNILGGAVGGAAGGLMTVSGPLEWDAGNFTGAGGTLRTLPSASFQMSGTANRTMTNYIVEVGTDNAAWTGTGQIGTGFGAILRVTAAGVLNIDAASGQITQNQGGAATLFENLGSLNKSTAATYTINMPFVSTGDISVTGGGILLSTAGGSFDGTASMGSASMLTLAGGTHTLANGFAVTGVGFVNIANGTVNVVNPADTAFISNLLISGGTFDPDGVVRATGTASWTAGNITGDGTLLIPVTAAFSISGTATRTLINTTIANHGVTSWTGDLTIQTGFGAVVRNMPGGTFNFSGSGLFTQNQGGTQTRFDNQGTFIRSTSAAASPWSVAFDMNQAGTGSQILSDGLQLLGGGIWNDTLSLSAQLTFGGGTFTFATGQAVIGTSLALLNGGSFVTATPADTAKFQNLELAGGSLQQSGVIRVNGTLNWSNATQLSGTGTTLVPAGASLLLTGAATRTFVNGTIQISGAAGWSGNFNLNTGLGATLRNLGSFGFTGGGAVIHNQGGVFNTVNGGTFTFNTAASIPWGGIFTDTTGNTSIVAGTLDLNGGARFGTGTNKSISAGATLLLSGGTITFRPGTIFSGAGVINLTGGTMTPDSGSAISPVSLVNLNLLGGTLSHEGRLEISTGGTLNWSASQISSNGTGLGGTTRILPGATMNINTTASRTFSGAHTIQNDGTVIWTSTGAINHGVGARIINNGLFDWQGDGTMPLNQGGSSTFFIGAGGTLRRSVGATSRTVDMVLNDSIGVVNSLSAGFDFPRGSVTNFSGSFTGPFIPRLTGGTFTVTPPGITAGNFEVAGGNLVLNGNSFVATGAFTTSNTGTLTMTNAADSLHIGGTALFQGGTSNLTQGRMILMGDFNQAGNTIAFVAGAGHRTALRGTVTQNINFASPTTSRFGRLETMAQNRNIVLQTDAEVLDSLHMLAGALPYQLNGPAQRLRVGGVLRLEIQTGSPRVAVRLLELGGIPSIAPFNGMTADTTAFITNTNVTLPVGGPFVYNSIRIQTGANFAMASDTISGNLEIVNGTALFNGAQTFRIGGDLRTRLSGVYSQTGGTSLVTVLDTASFAGAASLNITAGTLRLHGTFLQGGGAGDAFSASGTHVTHFTGPLAGSAIQPVSMANPGINAGESHFNRMDLTRSGGIVRVNLLSNIRARLVVDTSFGTLDTIQGIGSVQLTSDSVQLQGTVFSNARLSMLSGTAFQSMDGGRFINMNPADIFILLNRNAGVQSTFNNMFFGSTPTTGFYITINQLTGGAAASVNLPAPVTPSNPAGRYNRTGAAGPPNVVWAGVTNP